MNTSRSALQLHLTSRELLLLSMPAWLLVMLVASFALPAPPHRHQIRDALCPALTVSVPLAHPAPACYPCYRLVTRARPAGGRVASIPHCSPSPAHPQPLARFQLNTGPYCLRVWKVYPWPAHGSLVRMNDTCGRPVAAPGPWPLPDRRCPPRGHSGRGPCPRATMLGDPRTGWHRRPHGRSGATSGPRASLLSARVIVLC